VLTAIAAGAFGAVFASALTLLVWLSGVPGDIEEHDRLVAERDEDLASWVADEKVRLDLERKEILARLSAKGLLHSGTRISQLAEANERTLHAYRDQERAAKRFAARLRGKERFAHRISRRWRGMPFPEFTAVTRAAPVLAHWRQPESYEGAPAREVDDPTARTLESIVEDLS
jgi:hypothetical protein